MSTADAPPGGTQGKTKPRGWFFLSDSFTPKSIVCLREGYGRQFLLQDLFAGLTVGIVALPLSMALAIGSGVGPERGLFTAIIAGFLISLLGGSRVQIGGPTGAFMALVFTVVTRHGYDGLAICTLMAGIILIIMGIARLGTMIKFIPYPVTTGFTSGIAILIFSQQVKDFLGLRIDKVPAEFLEKWSVLLVHMPTLNLWSIAFGLGALIILILIRKFIPRLPGAMVVVLLGAVMVAVLKADAPQFAVERDGKTQLLSTDPGFALTTKGVKVEWSDTLRSAGNTPEGVEVYYNVETIGTRFGGIPRTLPAPSLPIKLNTWDDLWNAWAKARALIPEATTIALLAAIESLLCAVVADGMIGGRHKSNCELVAQGVANIGSIFFGGIPATGAIARTAANVKSGGRTPLAGMIHAATLVLFMLLLAPYAAMIPLSVLAAVLMLVAWGMAEVDHFRSILRAPRSDIAVLLTTFGLTVLADLTVAVGVGMVLAAVLFMKRMSEVTNVGTLIPEETADDLAESKDPNAISKRKVPKGVEVYEINGPFFFGVADRLKDTLQGLEKPPRVFILRMRRVPAIDASGMHALDEFHDKCRRQGTVLLLAGVHAQPMFALVQYGIIDKIGETNMFENLDDALARAGDIVGIHATPPIHHAPEVTRERNRSPNRESPPLS